MCARVYVWHVAQSNWAGKSIDGTQSYLIVVFHVLAFFSKARVRVRRYRILFLETNWCHKLTDIVRSELGIQKNRIYWSTCGSLSKNQTTTKFTFLRTWHRRIFWRNSGFRKCVQRLRWLREIPTTSSNSRTQPAKKQSTNNSDPQFARIHNIIDV